MRVFIESPIAKDPERGPAKFIQRLIPALANIGVACRFDNPRICDVSLGLSWWRPPQIPIPRLVRVDGLTMSNKGIGLDYIKRIAANVARCDAIIWQSEFSRRVIGLILGASAPLQFVIYNGASPSKNLAKTGEAGRRHVIMASNWLKNSGATRAIKRLKVMIDAARVFAKKRPDVIFWVAGKTNYSHIKHPNIKFLGQLDSESLNRHLYSANCSLFLGCYDACPNSVVESLVLGTPVICVNGSGPEELVRAGYGEVLPIDLPATPNRMMAGEIAPINEQAVVAALGRWVDCTEKKPAPRLLISETAAQYKKAFEMVLKRSDGRACA